MLLFLLLIFFAGLAVGLAWFLLANDHGQKEPVGMLWVALFLGVIGGLAAGYLESWLIDSKNILPGSAPNTMLMAMMTIGIIEEACKFIPLALVIYNKKYFNEYTDGIIYFALAGLGFGLPENILYTVQYGTQTGLARIVLTPLFHAAITAIVGYFLISAKLNHKHVATVIPVLLAAMGLHGLYDFGLSSGSTVFTAVSVLTTLILSALLFVLYVRATEKDQDMGLTAVGHNTYCRNCGHPNPSHHLYCTSCGKNA